MDTIHEILRETLLFKDGEEFIMMLMKHPELRAQLIEFLREEGVA